MKHFTLALVGLCTATAFTTADATTYTGRLDDSHNAALFDSSLGAPDFSSPEAIANNVAIFEIDVSIPGLTTIASSGFAAGGVDPYFTLFSGTGGGSGFVASNYDQAFTTGGDFSFSASLAPGRYVVALGAFANMSLAENLGSGTLADGFAHLGTASSLGDASYRLEVTTPVSEPSMTCLTGLGLWVLGRLASQERRRRRRDGPSTVIAL